MSERNYPEWNEQKALIDVAQMHVGRFGVLTGLFHCPNEAKRTRAQHGMLMAVGMRPGVSDLLLPRSRRGYLGLAIEMKAPGRITSLTKEQLQFLVQQRAEGWLCCSCDNAAAGWALLHWYATGERHNREPEAPPECGVRYVEQLVCARR